MSITDLVTGKFRMALMGAVLLLAFGAGWIANGWRLGEQLAALGKTHSDTLGEIARAGQQQLRVQIQRREVLEQKLADLDASTHKDLENAQAENERLLGLLVLMLSASGCGSRYVLPEPTSQCQKPPAPAAWAMEKGSNSVSELDQLFGISGEE